MTLQREVEASYDLRLASAGFLGQDRERAGNWSLEIKPYNDQTEYTTS